MNNTQKEFSEKVLQDLLALDPSLKSHEKELKKIIQEIIKLKPSAKLDENFKQSLRTELLQRAKELKSEVKHKNQNNSFLINLFTMNKFTSALAGALVMALFAIPLTYHFTSNQPSVGNQTYFAENNEDDSNESETYLASSDGEITKLKDNAFGSLASDQDSHDPTSSSARGLGGGGVMMTAKDAPAQKNITTNEEATLEKVNVNTLLEAEKAPMPVGKGVADIMPYPHEEPNTITLAYTGEPISLSEEKVTVLKKSTKNSSISASSLVKDLGFGVIDTSKFNNPKIQNISFSEDKEFGLGYYIDLVNNNISINKNYAKWPNPAQNCQNQNCFEQTRLKESDIPSDEKIIELADSFVKRFNLDLSKYADPIIQDEYRRYIEKEENFWIPEEISVIYPQIIAEKTVVDSFGNEAGISVSVDIRSQKGAGLHGLSFGDLESSDYEAITETDRIISLAEKGGSYPVYGYYNSDKTNYELDTPDEVIMKYYIWKDGESHEYYIPALRFKIKEAEENELGRKSIVIPLAKELLEEIENNRENHPILY